MAVKLGTLYDARQSYHRGVAYHALGLSRWVYNDNPSYDNLIQTAFGYQAFIRHNPDAPNAPQFLMLQDKVGWQIAIAGTTTLEQWISYVVQSGQVPVVNMLGNTFTAFESWANAIVASVVSVVQAGSPLFLTGHSLGGAMAILVAGKLINLGRSPRCVYTFGSPRVGDYVFAQNYEVVAHNVLNAGDPVPFAPPSALTTYTTATGILGILPELLRPGSDYLMHAPPDLSFNPLRIIHNLTPLGAASTLATRVSNRHLIDTYIRDLWKLGTFADHRKIAEWANIWTAYFGIALTPPL